MHLTTSGLSIPGDAAVGRTESSDPIRRRRSDRPTSARMPRGRGPATGAARRDARVPPPAAAPAPAAADTAPEAAAPPPAAEPRAEAPAEKLRWGPARCLALMQTMIPHGKNSFLTKKAGGNQTQVLPCRSLACWLRVPHQRVHPGLCVPWRRRCGRARKA